MNELLLEVKDLHTYFRTDDGVAKAVSGVDFAINKLGLNKIAIIHDKGDYGKPLAEGAKKYVETSGKGEVVLFEGITPGAMDYSAIVQKIKKSVISLG